MLKSLLLPLTAAAIKPNLRPPILPITVLCLRVLSILTAAPTVQVFWQKPVNVLGSKLKGKIPDVTYTIRVALSPMGVATDGLQEVCAVPIVPDIARLFMHFAG